MTIKLVIIYFTDKLLNVLLEYIKLCPWFMFWTWCWYVSPRCSTSWLRDEVKTSWTVWRQSWREVRQRRASGSSLESAGLVFDSTLLNSSVRVTSSVDTHYTEISKAKAKTENVEESFPVSLPAPVLHNTEALKCAVMLVIIWSVTSCCSSLHWGSSSPVPPGVNSRSVKASRQRNTLRRASYNTSFTSGCEASAEHTWETTKCKVITIAQHNVR